MEQHVRVVNGPRGTFAVLGPHGHFVLHARTRDALFERMLSELPN
jgi:hypothetical protein